MYFLYFYKKSIVVRMNLFLNIEYINENLYLILIYFDLFFAVIKLNISNIFEARMKPCSMNNN